jgi:uncharacterized protein (TIGR00251 family)
MRVTVFPGSKKVSVKELDTDHVEVHLKAKSERNQANVELVVVLAEYFGVSPASVHILTGHHSRRKRVEINE